MAATTAKEIVVFRDAKGRTARFSFFVGPGTLTAQFTAAHNVNATLAALSNAGIQSRRGPDTSGQQQVIYGNTAQFQNIEDKVQFTFQCSDGSIHRYQIPAPVASIFLTDLETVDPANANVLAFIDAMEVNATSLDGLALFVYLGGVRVRRKMQKRLNIMVLGPGDVIEIPAE